MRFFNTVFLSLSSKKIVLSFFIFSSILTSCAYRFSLTSRDNKGHYQSLYLAKSLNPVGSLLPYEILEEEVQKFFIQDFPEIELLSIERAQLFMRFVIQDLRGDLLDQTEVLEAGKANEGPNEIFSEDGNLKPALLVEDLKTSSYPLLSQEMVYGLVLELWDLEKKEKIFTKKYKGSEVNKIFFSPERRLIEMDRQEKKDFKVLSEKLARKIMIDLMRVL